ncbi:MAG: 5-oxoprolinase subunit PxpB [Cyclobacteriaceae bacterium]|nr:5-oxoprolinase subunit PxpB [Cyclobacteriaceae bacterium HetDA_MAG_MS6]
MKIVPLGDQAVEIQISKEHLLDALRYSLEDEPAPGQKGLIPCLTSIAVIYDPFMVNFEQMVQNIEARKLTKVYRSKTARLFEFPISYDKEFGGDQELVARKIGTSVAELVQLHREQTYRVAMTGFVPGFSYMQGLPDKLHVGRHPNPRAKVPAGSVAIADAFTAIYPAETPGGWNLIGYCPVTLFDLKRDRPFALVSGDRIRFREVAKSELTTLSVDPLDYLVINT